MPRCRHARAARPGRSVTAPMPRGPSSQLRRRSAAMAIQLWDPVHEMVSLRDAMNSLLQDSYVRPTGMRADGGPAMLPLDISENENEFIVKASLPGIRPEDVQITAQGDMLTIRGEMKAE